MTASASGTERISVLLYCDADLNLIDGSAVWTTSVAQVLALDPRVRVTLLLKCSLSRPLLTAPLGNRENIEVFDAYAHQAEFSAVPGWEKSPRLQPEIAAALMADLDARRQFDLVLVRGLKLCGAVVNQPGLRGRIWAYLTDFTEESVEQLGPIYEGATRLLCQTRQLQAKLQSLLGAGPEKMLLLPPMIPEASQDRPAFLRQGQRIVYVGKLAPLWRSEEMVELVPEIRERHPGAEVHVAGDKFHNFPPSPDFPEHMQALLEGTPGVVWHRALTREQTQELIRACDVGYSWRHPHLDESLELSTKVLEYGLQGKPVLLNRVPMHEELLGADYPLYCNTREEVLESVGRAFTDNAAYEMAARRVWKASQRFTFLEAAKRLAPHLPEPRRTAAEPGAGSGASSSPGRAGGLRVVFAGHDLKFAGGIMEGLRVQHGFEVRADEWAGHDLHDERQSRELAEWAEVVVAEWCLGNAVWYSRHLPARTGLIVRLHRVELETSYPEELQHANVHCVVAVSPAFAEKMRSRLPGALARVVAVPNAVDCRCFDQPKLGGSEVRLGLLGFCPRLKRLDLALDIFAWLRRRDPRYVLFIKGRLPTEHHWVWRDREEREYYRAQMARLNHSPWRNSVVFEPFGDDVPTWFRKIGFILSTSDVESFHLSIAEGMASGAVPIIREREGVAGLYPEEYVFSDTREAVESIERFRAAQDGGRGEALKHFCREHFDLPKVVRQWHALIAQVYEEVWPR